MTNKERARLVAQEVHKNQKYDIYPYIYHIEQVVYETELLGYDEDIVIGSYLHDSQEDGDLSYNDIKKAFGLEVAEIVFCVTDELGRNRKERKQKTYPKIRANWRATVVKICDRIANVKHSQQYTPRLYDMYVKEQGGFLEGIFSSDHPKDVKKAWVELYKLLGTELPEKIKNL